MWEFKQWVPGAFARPAFGTMIESLRMTLKKF
jgi:hypothetical protein